MGGDERIYLINLARLRRAFPKFFLLIVLLSLTVLFVRFIFIPLAKNIEKAGELKLTSIVSSIGTGFSLILIILTFREISEVSESLAGISAYFLNINKESSINKLRRSFKIIAYIFFLTLLLWLFKDFIENINPSLPGVLLILLVLGTFISLYAIFYNLIVESEVNIREIFFKIYKKKRKR